MVSCLGSLVQYCCGEGGALQTELLYVGSTHSVLATLGLPSLTGMCSPRLHCSDSRLLCMERARCCMRIQFSGAPQKWRGDKGQAMVRWARKQEGQQTEGWGKVRPPRNRGIRAPTMIPPWFSWGAQRASSGILEFAWDQTPHNNRSHQWAIL